MGRWLVVLVIVLAGCDRVLGLDRPCNDRFGGDCATCGQIGQSCCAGEIACGDGLFCGDGTCSECVTDVALGRRHMCSLRYDGTVWCSGQNESAQLGQPMSALRTTEPIEVQGPFDHDVISIGSGRSHVCAVRRDGTVWCWGHRSQGQLGDGIVNSESGVSTPVQVTKVDKSPLTGIKAVTAGYCNTCAVDTAGGGWCWGCDDTGELGDGVTVRRARAAPVLSRASEPFTDIAEITVGHQHSCLRTNAGAAWCWGEDLEGQVGNGVSPAGNLTTFEVLPVKILDDVRSIAAGSDFTCASLTDGTARCWGNASGDRLGNGEEADPADKYSPELVVEQLGGPAFTHVTQVSVGAVGCVLSEDSALWCWGKNSYGTTGGGGSLVPAPVISQDAKQLVGADRLRGHYAHTCAHLVDGRFVCWGRNTSGELANGTFIHTNTPAVVKLTCP